MSVPDVSRAHVGRAQDRVRGIGLVTDSKRCLRQLLRRDSSLLAPACVGPLACWGIQRHTQKAIHVVEEGVRGLKAIAQSFMRPKRTRHPFHIRGESNGIIGMGRTVKPHGGKGTNESLLPLCAITLDLPQQPR